MLEGQPLHLLKYALQILTDALRRVSAHLGEHTARGTWSLPEASYTYLKPRRSFGPKRVPRPLVEPYCYHSYRQHHVGCLFKQGESKAGPLCALLWSILSWCSRKQAQAQHIHASTMFRPGIHCHCICTVTVFVCRKKMNKKNLVKHNYIFKSLQVIKSLK